MKLNRRSFLELAALAGAAAASPGPANGQVPAATIAHDPQRPQFHLMPPRNWMNDPNGPIHLDGRYHMFFQYNPEGPLWGNMSWGHAVSPDMLHWSHLPVSMTPTPGSTDAYGCFSGSALQVGRRTYAVYTGTVKSTPELATIKHDGVQESQCLAWSDDPALLRWTKAPHPVIPLPPPGLKVTGFRDPSAWKQGDWYYMTVGAGIEGVGGCVLLYRSRDLHTWEYLHPLATGHLHALPGSALNDGGDMWECPEFFSLDNGHVLIYSTLGKAYWQSGDLDAATLRFVPKRSGCLDLGPSFYAPKTQLDAQDRRILWGWLREQRPDATLEQAGWAGVMSLPRVLRLDAHGQLCMELLPEAAKLRGPRLSVQASANDRRVTLPQANGEVRCSAADTGEFGLGIAHGEQSLLRIGYSPADRTWRIADQQVAVPPGEPLAIQIVVDASVIEIVLNGLAGYTSRFYLPGTRSGTRSGTVAPDLLITASGPQVHTLEGWTVTPVSADRLTT